MAEEYVYLARFDGACHPNPGGHASCACVIFRDGKEVYRESKYLGRGKHTTNNVAEFCGLLMVLRWVRKNCPQSKTLIVSDSQIVVRRMQSHTLPGGVCRDAARECQNEARGLNVRFVWQSREENGICDGLCTVELTRRGVKTEVWLGPENYSLEDELRHIEEISLGRY